VHRLGTLEERVVELERRAGIEHKGEAGGNGGDDDA